MKHINPHKKSECDTCDSKKSKLWLEDARAYTRDRHEKTQTHIVNLLFILWNHKILLVRSTTFYHYPKKLMEIATQYLKIVYTSIF